MNFGPIGIDLAGILVDHYIELDLKVLKKYTDIFAELSSYGLSPEETLESTCWGALQRNLRIMGTLTSLYLRSNRSSTKGFTSNCQKYCYSFKLFGLT